MQKFISVIVTAFVALTMSAAAKDIREVTFSTKLHCQNCVNKVIENISYVKGVKDLNVSLEKQEITVKYDSAKTDEEKIVSEIKKLGFPAIRKTQGTDTIKQKQ